MGYLRIPIAAFDFWCQHLPWIGPAIKITRDMNVFCVWSQDGKMDARFLISPGQMCTEGFITGLESNLSRVIAHGE